jgi:hypothetical protein
MVGLGGKALHFASVSNFLVFGPTICSVYHSTFHYSESGETECKGGHLRSEPLDVAWLENCQHLQS